MKQYYLYIMGNKNKGNLTIDITENLVGMLSDNEKSFKSRKDFHLVYFERTENIFNALKCKMEYDKWSGIWKTLLIEKSNPQWKDLFLELLYQTNSENVVKF